jgi:cytosine permease
MGETVQSDQAADYAGTLVPESARGSAWRVFFIVAGSMGGLPTFILSANVFAGLGLSRGLAATAIGCLLSATLGGLSAFCGSRTRMGLAVLADSVFGHWGGRLVKLVIAFSLVGWFAVEIAVLGSTLATSIRQIFGATVPAFSLSIPFALGIAVITSYGTQGLERMGQILVPIILLCLAASLVLTARHASLLAQGPGNGALGFGAAVSAITGSYIVGIVIQPDYSRFVRHAVPAGLATFAALGAAFPAYLLFSAIPTLALAQPNLIGAMIVLGLGVPALAILTLGAAIDTSACLYSGSLPIASEILGARLSQVIAGVAGFAIVATLLHVETYFIPFLVLLGVALPPLAIVLIVQVLSHDVEGVRRTMDLRPMLAWLGGAAAGDLTDRHVVTLTGLPALDSVLAAVALLALFRCVVGRGLFGRLQESKKT